MIYFSVRDKHGKILAANCSDFSRFESSPTNQNRKNGKGVKFAHHFDGNLDVSIAAENEPDLLKSSKLFSKTFEIYKSISLSVYGSYQREINAYTHSLTTIHAQIGQRVDDFASSDDFYGETYAESVSKILKLLEEDKHGAADLVCYLQKRVIDMRAHFLGAEVIHFGEQYKTKNSRVSLKRAILNQYTPFAEGFEKNLVKVKIFFDEGCEIEVDKNMFSLVMYNFLSNAFKYAMANTEIRFHFNESGKKLDVSMISLKMEKEEINKLFEEGARGCHALQIPGKGVGLFVIQKALRMMGKEPMYIDPDYSKSYVDNEFPYIENHFKFVF